MVLLVQDVRTDIILRCAMASHLTVYYLVESFNAIYTETPYCGLGTPLYIVYIVGFIRAKSDYYLRHVCLSVRPSEWKN